jgi:glycosyltransferase involved in cell wall biosynthesis
MISVVLCTYNRASSLRRTLESFGRMSVVPDFEWELLIVDNNSSDNTCREVNAFTRNSGLNIRYIWEPRTGKSHALNRGISEARGEIIAFTDDDVQVSREWLSELSRTFSEFDCIGVGGRVIAVWDGIVKPDWFATAGPYFLGIGAVAPQFERGDRATEISTPAVGANMAFRREAFEKYGSFRTDMGPGVSRGSQLGEDYEFENRLLHAGEKIIYSPTAVIFHPAVQDRITKKCILRFYFNRGRTDIRLDGWPADAALHFGIPRYMFRMLLERCGNWLFALGAQKRLYRKAQLYSLVGEMIEARASQKKKEHLAAPRGSRRAY